MKRFIATSLIAVFVLCLMLTNAQSQKRDTVDEFMRAKLVHAQKVVEGLTSEGYELIAKSSQQLSLLSQAAQWQVLQTPEYARRSAEFRRAADKLAQAGKDKNLDAALLAYVDVTMKCVECHKYIRTVQNARLDDFRSPLAPVGATGE